MLLATLAHVSREVAATSARSRKIALLAELFGAAEPADVPVVIPWLAGRLPQGRIGVGRHALKDPAPPAETATLTVRRADDVVTALAAVTGPGSQTERRRLVQELLGAATEEEQRFLIALLFGEVRQGALDAVAGEALAQATQAPPAAVRRAVMLAGSLQSVAERLLADGPDALAEFRLTVGRPVLPMLAQTASGVIEAVGRLAPCGVEEKLDGIRVQVHRTGDAVRVYTRTLDDITDRLPEVTAAALALDGDGLILDGEVIALDADGRPRAFQEVAGRVGSRTDVGRRPPPCRCRRSSSTCSPPTARICSTCRTRSAVRRWTGWSRSRCGSAGWWCPRRTATPRPTPGRRRRSGAPRWTGATRVS